MHIRVNLEVYRVIDLQVKFATSDNYTKQLAIRMVPMGEKLSYFYYELPN
jgi:hypothetical protein